MSNASFFGFSGFDPIGTAANGWSSGQFGQVFGKKSLKTSSANQRAMMRYQQLLAQQQMEFQSNLNKANQTWAARQMPTETVQGLRAAGLNPMLAYTDFSGLASSGAMGVTPSAPSGTGASISSQADTSGGDVGFDSSAIKQFRDRKKETAERDAARSTAEVNKEVAETEKEFASDKTTSANQVAIQENELKSQKLENESIQEAIKTYLLGHELSVTTGKQYATHQGKGLAGSDEANQFWNDFYREKRDLSKYMNSATRAKVLDSIHGFQSGAAGLSSLTDLIPSRLSKIRRFFKWK